MTQSETRRKQREMRERAERIRNARMYLFDAMVEHHTYTYSDVVAAIRKVNRAHVNLPTRKQQAAS